MRHSQLYWQEIWLNLKLVQLLLADQVSSFEMVNLAFAWTQAADVPLILGQANFFFEFEVCFFRALSEFEIRPNRVEDKRT